MSERRPPSPRQIGLASVALIAIGWALATAVAQSVDAPDALLMALWIAILGAGWLASRLLRRWAYPDGDGTG